VGEVARLAFFAFAVLGVLAPGADVGIAGGNGEGLIFRKGEVVRKVKEEDLLSELFREIDAILEERKTS